MSENNKLAALIASCAMLAVTAAASAEPRTQVRHRAYHRHHPVRSAGCQLHRNPEGELVDCQGWRHRDNAIGWDNTCFNLDYLPSMYACGSTNGGW
ncbi:MAG: hypothetical protein ACLP7P_21260 [Rhodomicrobium sp.]